MPSDNIGIIEVSKHNEGFWIQFIFLCSFSNNHSFLKYFYPVFCYFFKSQICWTWIFSFHFSDIQNLASYQVDSIESLTDFRFDAHSLSHTQYINCDTYLGVPYNLLGCFVLKTSCVDKIFKDIPKNCHVKYWTWSAAVLYRFICKYYRCYQISRVENQVLEFLTLGERSGIQAEIARNDTSLKWHHLMLIEHVALPQTSENHANMLMNVWAWTDILLACWSFH